MKKEKAPREIKRATLGFSVLTLVVLVAVIAVLLTAASAPIVVVMMLSWLVLVPFAIYLGYDLDQVEKFALEMIRPAVGVMALMIAIGGMISIWLCAGTVPSIIYWGLKIISPGAFLLVAFILTSVVSLPIGTSWGAVATIGVAMMGVGLGLGLPPGLVAGSVISGAYFGNGLSPVSDAPLFMSTVTNVKIWDHVKHMSITAILAWVISAILYAVIGMRFTGHAIDMASINDILASLEAIFNISWVSLIPMAVVIVMMVLRYSALMSILCGSVVGILVAVFFQDFSLTEVIGYMNTGFTATSENALVSSLLNRGGFTSMYDLVAIIIGSLGIGGILKGTGVLDVVISSLSKHMKSVRSLTVTTFVSSIITTMMVGTYYFCMTIVSTMMCPLYKKAGYKPENAGRIINNIANCLVAFLPWNVGCQYMATQTGVEVGVFAPFVFFNILVIAIDFIFGFFDIKPKKYTEEEMKQFAMEEDAAAAKRT